MKTLSRLVSFCILTSMVAACSGGSRLSTMPASPGASKTTNALAGSVPTLPTGSLLLRPLDMIATTHVVLSGSGGPSLSD